jgi:hypothetical protein
MWYNIRVDLVAPSTWGLSGGRQITKLNESMVYVAQSRSNPAGNTKFTAGSVQFSESMDVYGFGEELSAEWVGSVQKTFACYTRLLRQFEIDTHPN